MYIPSSQYKTGFHSNGEYYFDGDNTTPYYGPYWILLDGKIYSGKKPSDDSKLLIKRTLQGDFNPDSSPDYFKGDPTVNLINHLIKEDNERALPRSFFPTITPQDIELGKITRYYVKRNDQYLYYETNENDYFSLSNSSQYIAWDLYSTCQIEWIIKGDTFNVLKTNKDSVLSIESQFSQRNPNGKNWKNFSQIFKDNYLQFYQDIQENLSTLGGEYKTSDGKEYIGLYHIHPEKGPMVGAKHVSTPHDYLYKIDTDIPQSQPSLTNISYNTPSPSTGGSSNGGGNYGGGGSSY